MGKKENKNKKVKNKRDKKDKIKEKNMKKERPDTKTTKKVKKIFISIIIILAIIFVLALAYLIYDIFFNKSAFIKSVMEVDASDVSLEVVDLKSDSRPYAVMIGNTEDAWPQFNVNEALVVYEMPVEFGITRLLAIFKDKNLDKIGSLRSARHYFIDYVKEYDAIYVHEGFSPRAQSEIRSRDVDSLVHTEGLFYRDESRYAPQNAITSTKRIKDAIKTRGFSTKTKKEIPLKFSRTPVRFKDAISATSITTNLSDMYDLKLKYNEEKQKYEKYELGELVKDGASKEPLAATNIIMLHADSELLYGFGSGKGRIHLDTTQKMKGYFISHGKAVKITAVKESEDSQTKYFLENEEELRINDGNTFIFFVPYSEDIKIAPGKELEDDEISFKDLFEDKRIKIKKENQVKTKKTLLKKQDENKED